MNPIVDFLMCLDRQPLNLGGSRYYLRLVAGCPVEAESMGGRVACRLRRPRSSYGATFGLVYAENILYMETQVLLASFNLREDTWMAEI